MGSLEFRIEVDFPILTGSDSIGPGPRVVRATIDFSAYTEFKLHPIKDIEVPETEDGHINLTAYCLYPMTLSHDWRMREGGVLYALGEYGDFFNAILGYHGSGKSTNIEEWNSLFRNLQNSGYPKNIIPCMVSKLHPVDSGSILTIAPQFFGQKDGCLNRNCPFLHNRDAVLADRAHILEERRKRVSDYKHAPTVRQHLTRYHSVLDCVAGPDRALRDQIAESRVVDKGMAGDRAYCANPRCLKPWKKDEVKKPLKACKGCKMTMYCSVSVSLFLGIITLTPAQHECQKVDWPRHKKDPCAPIEDLVENDDLWNPIGTRKGTGYFFKTQKDMQTMTFHRDA